MEGPAMRLPRFRLRTLLVAVAAEVPPVRVLPPPTKVPETGSM